MDKRDVEQIIRDEKAKGEPGCVGAIMLLLSIAFMFAIVCDVLVSFQPIERIDSSGRQFICWPTPHTSQFFQHLRHQGTDSDSEICVAVDHVRPLRTK